MFGSTPEEQAENALMSPMGVGVMIAGSPLRRPAYRKKMLRALGKQIKALEPSMARTMFRRLIGTHPRVMSAFQHSGGALRRDPEYTPEFVKEAISKSQRPTRGGRFFHGESEKVRGESARIPDLRGVYRDPIIDITPESFSREGLAGRDAFRSMLERERLQQYSANVAAHEMTHWAQHLGGRGAKRFGQVTDELNEMVDRRATVIEAFPLRRERQELINQLEKGARKAGAHQTDLMTVAHVQNEERGILERILRGVLGRRPVHPRRQITADLGRYLDDIGEAPTLRPLRDLEQQQGRR